MICYAENPVKLLKLVDDDKVKIMIWHTEQVITVPIKNLYTDDGNIHSIPDIVRVLKDSASLYNDWMIKNG